MATAKKSIQRRLQKDKGLEEFLPTSVQKSYSMLSDAERDVLSHALEKYRPNQSEPIFVGGKNQLKPALRLMTNYRLVIEEIEDGKVISPASKAACSCGIACRRIRRARIRRDDVPELDRARGEPGFKGSDKCFTESSKLPGCLQATFRTQFIIGHRDHFRIPIRYPVGPAAEVAELITLARSSRETSAGGQRHYFDSM